MFDHIKNLIRHGKQATKATPNKRVGHDRYPKTPAPVQEDVLSEISPRTRIDDSALAQIVAEEKEERTKMPKYPGLQKYKILEKMGDGAFSTVYKALDTITQQKVAIKVVRRYELDRTQERHLHRDVKRKPRAIERANVLKEVQIMRQLKHSSIVSLLSFSEDKDYYYLILELMEGGELFHQIVKLTYFSEPLARHVILQVAEGIRYLHEERGVVHRDIKPENLLFEPIKIIPSKVPPSFGPNDEPKEDEGEFIPGVGGGGIGRIKIADFGLSKVVWDQHTMTPCGTVGYTAPEVIKEQRYCKSVDIWALGCVLYTLLCGFPPFYDESIPTLTEKVAKGQYTFLSPWWDDISASSKDLVSRLLEVDPEKRYTIGEFFEHPWVKDDSFKPPSNVATQEIINETNRQESTIPGTPNSRIGRLLPPDAFSPGITSLKEAFDLSYAVHRMEEEAAQKRKSKTNPSDAIRESFLKNAINRAEDESEDDDDESSTSSLESIPAVVSTTSPHSNEPVKMQTGVPHVSAKQKRRNFDLNLEGATLLSRRRKALEAIGS